MKDDSKHLKGARIIDRSDVTDDITKRREKHRDDWRKREAAVDDQITAEAKRLISEVLELHILPRSEAEFTAKLDELAANFPPPIMLATLLTVVVSLADRLGTDLSKHLAERLGAKP